MAATLRCAGARIANHKEYIAEDEEEERIAERGGKVGAHGGQRRWDRVARPRGDGRPRKDQVQEAVSQPDVAGRRFSYQAEAVREEAAG